MMLRFDLTLAAGTNHCALRAAASVEQGVTLLTGPSGAGKSTLLSLLAGVVPPQRGLLTFGDVTWSRDQRMVVPSHLRGIGWQPQTPSLVPHWSAHEHLRAADPYRSPNPVLEARTVASLALDKLLHRPAATLSAGEAQRVALLRALASCRGLLLLDEPVSALQPPLAQRALELIAALTDEQGWTTVLVSHQPANGLQPRVLLSMEEGLLSPG